MTITVLLQLWGPLENSGCNYGWITVGRLTNPERFDLEYLKQLIVEHVRHSEWKPTTNMARLEFRQDGKAYMKATFMDLWENDNQSEDTHS